MLGTIAVASRTGIIYLPYTKKNYKRDIANYGPISLVNLDYKTCTNSNAKKIATVAR